MRVEGYIRYIELSDEWDEKPMQDIKKLATVYLVMSPRQEVWGDDWNDSPAIHNAGPPYDLKKIDLEAGDHIIIFKEEKA